VAMPLARISASGCSQVDGPRLVEDVSAGEANKKLVAEYVFEVLDGRFDRAGSYLAAAFVDHHPAGSPHVGGPAYRRLVRLVGCGNFVAVVSRAIVGDRGALVCDLYRLAEGLIVEHWDTCQLLPVGDDAFSPYRGHATAADTDRPMPRTVGPRSRVLAAHVRHRVQLHDGHDQAG
jgi:predicted SnoaL-like aldol condensation-catalyzing enzyme